ncbi:hypothetical protein [Thermococcus sp.]
MRYQEWWFWYLPQEFSKYFDEVVVVAPDVKELKKSRPEMFSPIDEAIEFEAEQVKEFIRKDVRDTDYIFFADISFTGIVPQVIYLKRKGRKFGFAHATSLNRYDYFAPVRQGKFMQEAGIMKTLDGVFVGSYYHKGKIINDGKYGMKSLYDKIHVVGLPKPPFRTYKEPKEYDVLFAGRRTKQKFNRKLWKIVLSLDLDARIRFFGSWEEYYMGLSRAKVVLMMSREETYGYQVVEAIMNNSVVLAPRCCSFPELLPNEYLYGDAKELVERLLFYVEHYERVPELRREHLELQKNWFKNVYKIMTEQ